MEKKEKAGGSMDYFWQNTTTAFQTSAAGLGVIGVCRSRCIQNGEACPIYKTCTQKNMIRDILP